MRCNPNVPVHSIASTHHSEPYTQKKATITISARLEPIVLVLYSGIVQICIWLTMTGARYGVEYDTGTPT